jgi:hypothetical protein
MNEVVYTILYNVSISLASFLTFLLAYAFRRADGFNISVWLAENGMRLGLGGGLLILVSILMEVSQEFDAILSAIGFNTNASPVALGLAVGAVAVGSLRTQN